MVLLLMKINDGHDSITNTFTIQVTSHPLFSKVERGLIELSVDRSVHFLIGFSWLMPGFLHCL